MDVDHFRAIAEAYRPCESKLRKIIPKIMAVRGQPELLEPLGEEMSETLTHMELAVRPKNALLLKEMTARLTQIMEDQDQASAGRPSPILLV